MACSHTCRSVSEWGMFSGSHAHESAPRYSSRFRAGTACSTLPVSASGALLEFLRSAASLFGTHRLASRIASQSESDSPLVVPIASGAPSLTRRSSYSSNAVYPSRFWDELWESCPDLLDLSKASTRV